MISVRPDLEVICSCHGPGLVEIKCPASVIGKVPCIENYHNLELSDGKIKLKRNSEYYFQIQDQIAVTECIVTFLYFPLLEMQQFD